jgi:two-component SAPR family response regulator
VDVHDFYSLCKQEAWDQALKTVHGEFLPEYPYAEWLFFERQRIAPLYQRALFLNAQSCVQASRYADALEFVRCLLTLEPWHEDAVLLGMQACMALDDKTGARRLYKQLEKTLSAELNTQPHADLTAYFQNLNQRNK